MSTPAAATSRSAPVSTRRDDPAQLAAVTFLARYTGHTRELGAWRFIRGEGTPRRCAAGSAGARPTTWIRSAGSSAHTSSSTSGTCTSGNPRLVTLVSRERAAALGSDATASRGLIEVRPTSRVAGGYGLVLGPALMP